MLLPAPSQNTDAGARLGLLAGLAAGLGVATGFVALALVRLIGLITNLAIFHRYQWTLPLSSSFPTGPGLYVAAVGGALVVSLLAKWARSSGAMASPQPWKWSTSAQPHRPLDRVAKPISAAVTIGTGGPFGAEGPIIVTGGAMGSLVGQLLSVSTSERKILLGVGAAAGMTAISGTPLAAVVLVIELLVFEYSTGAVLPLLIGTGVAAAMHNALFESGPLFTGAAHAPINVAALPAFALLGGLCALAAVIVTKGLFLIEVGFRRLPDSEVWHRLIGAVGFATVGQFVPGALDIA